MKDGLNPMTEIINQTCEGFTRGTAKCKNPAKYIKKNVMLCGFHNSKFQSGKQVLTHIGFIQK